MRLFLLLTAVLNVSHAFNVTVTSSGFTVSVRDVTLLEHTLEMPILFVGKGEVEITEDSGNFYYDTCLFSRVPLTSYKIQEDNGDYIISLSQNKSYQIILRVSGSGTDTVDISFDYISGGINFFWLRLKAYADEEVYGGGEQYSFFNLRERDEHRKNTFPIWINEQGVGRNKRTLTTFQMDAVSDAGGDYHTTYFGQPTFVSSRNYWFHYHGNNYVVMDFNGDEFHEFFVYGSPSNYTLSVSDSLPNTVKSVTSYLGNMPELPDWIQERVVVAIQGGTEQLVDKIKIAKDHGIPISGVWIQDWSGQVSTSFGTRVNWDWKWDPYLYPGLDELIKEWKAEGIRILGYINPNLNNEGELFAEAEGKGYLVNNSTGGTYLRNSLTLVFGQVDMTNPEAYRWYKEVIKTNMIGLGLGGWMADFGEYLATDAVLFDGRRGIEAHNEWPALWAKLNREALEETKTVGDVVFFTRSGFTGTSNYSVLHWNGDQNVDFSYDDGVRSTIYGSLGAGMNGITFSHFDVGGYTTVPEIGLVRTEELLLRSSEYAVFTPVFRCHQGNQIEHNVQWYDVDTGLTDKFAVHAQNFNKLAPYRKAVSKESVASKLPAMRLTSLVFPDDPLIVAYDQYMFGTDLLVAPVYKSNCIARSVTLPQLPDGETWIYIWTGEHVDGFQILTIDAPLGYPPVFYRSSSAYASVFQTLRKTSVTSKSSNPADSDSGVSGSARSHHLALFLPYLIAILVIRD